MLMLEDLLKLIRNASAMLMIDVQVPSGDILHPHADDYMNIVIKLMNQSTIEPRQVSITIII